MASRSRQPRLRPSNPPTTPVPQIPAVPLIEPDSKPAIFMQSRSIDIPKHSRRLAYFPKSSRMVFKMLQRSIRQKCFKGRVNLPVLFCCLTTHQLVNPATHPTTAMPCRGTTATYIPSETKPQPSPALGALSERTTCTVRVAVQHVPGIKPGVHECSPSNF